MNTHASTPRLRRLLSYPPLVLGLFVLLILLIVVLFGPMWGSYDPYLVAQSQRPYYDSALGKMVKPPFPPSAEYPLGTDQWGNDLLSLILYGARTTLVAGFYVSVLRVLLGLLLGALAGWRESRWLDRTIAAASAITGSVPALLSSLIIIYALNIQRGLWVFLVALTLVGWTETAQLIRTEVMRIRRAPYIETAESIGLSSLQIVVRHFLPNLLPYLLVILSLEMSAVLLLMAELGFLGAFIGGTSLYIPDAMSSRAFFLPETPEWGALVAQGAPFFRAHPNIVLAPALAFVLASVGFNVLGEGLRWLFDRWPVSTAVLLRKRTLAAMAVLVVISVFIISMTGAKTSFMRVAHAFDTGNAMQHAQQLAAAAQSDDPATAIEAYVEQEMAALHVQPGYKVGMLASYHNNYELRLAELPAPPSLTLEDGDGGVTFRYGEDFVVAENSITTGGEITGTLTLVSRRTFYGLEKMPKSQLQHHIFMVWEATMPSYFVPALASGGAAGVLLVSESATFAPQQSLLLVAPEPEQATTAFPIFRITRQAAERLLATLELTPEEAFFANRRPKDTGLVLHMSLDLSANDNIPVHNTIGFLGGYDTALAQEMVVLFMPYDSRHQQPAAYLNLGIMLEMLRTWEENHVDPRRSLLLVAWDNATLGSPAVGPYLANNDNFKKLTGLANSAPLRPVAVWQLHVPATDGKTVAIAPRSDQRLFGRLQEADRLLGTPYRIRLAEETGGPSFRLPTPALVLAQPPASDLPAEALGAVSEALGEMYSYVLLQSLRQVQ